MPTSAPRFSAPSRARRMRVALGASVTLLAAVGAHAAPAGPPRGARPPVARCSLAPVLLSRWKGATHLVVAPSADTVATGPGAMDPVEGVGHSAMGTRRAVYGQRVTVARMGGALSDEIEAAFARRGVREVLLVPWDYDPACHATYWGGSARWLPPEAPRFLVAQPRLPGAWIDGVPTFDVTKAGRYVQPPLRAIPMPALAASDAFDFHEALPSAYDGRGRPLDVEALRRWLVAHPTLVDHWPVPQTLQFVAPALRSATPADTAALRPTLDALHAALARADTAALRRHLAEDLVWTDGTTGATRSRVALLHALGARGPDGATITRDSVGVRLVGEVAFVDSRRTDVRRLGAASLATRWRVLDALAWRDGRWQLVHHARTWLVAPVAPLAGLDSAAHAPFVGAYEVAPGIVDDVRWERGALVATLRGADVPAGVRGARLVPVSTSTFSPDGTGALLAFERDAAGRVVGYVQGFPDGRIQRRRRLP